jgi:hypothetical protein
MNSNDSAFKLEPEACKVAKEWMNELAIAIFANRGNPVPWDYKNLQDRFRKFNQSHIQFLDALRERNFINITQKGNSRRFELMDRAWGELATENYRWLRLLKIDPTLRKRNKSAIAKRKKRRKVYANPTMRIIDDFRYGVEFERAGLLRQLRLDKDVISSSAKSRTPRAHIRFANVVHPLLAFETRNFCDLKIKNGVIYHEFMSIPWNYRRFATFNGKPFLGHSDIGKHLPSFLKELHGKLFPPLHAFGESLGLTIVYEDDGVAFFGEKNDGELPDKMDKVKAFIHRLSAEHSEGNFSNA